MYKAYDTSEAIRSLQILLSEVGDGSISVVPSGVFDDNTRLALIAFQAAAGLGERGVADYETTVRLLSEYEASVSERETLDSIGAFIDFPLSIGDRAPALVQLNRTLRELLLHYGFQSNIRDTEYFSEATLDGVLIMREVFMLPPLKIIDTELYRHMIRDYNSISGFYPECSSD